MEDILDSKELLFGGDNQETAANRIKG